MTTCIDLAKYPDATSLGNVIRENVRNVGFLAFVNHGLEDKIDDMFTLSENAFAELTDEDKKKFKIRSDNNQGYTAVAQEILDPEHVNGDGKESYNIGTVSSRDALAELPAPLEREKDKIWEFENACFNLSQRLLRGFATSLGLPEDSFSKHHKLIDDGVSILRLLHYIPVSDAAKAISPIRAGAHTDYGSLTLLFQREPGYDGLQLNLNDEWKPVHIPENAVLVNVADQLEFWSSGILRSTTHRVMLPEKGPVSQRYSIAFFNHPLPETRLDSLVSADAVDKSQLNRVEKKGISLTTQLNSYEYLQKRLSETYRALTTEGIA